MRQEWTKLLNNRRRKPKSGKATAGAGVADDGRTQFERDYDRILFSTPVRRMADKTQVFPLDPNDSVRTRLTHSHEVANLCRSIGVSLAYGALKDVTVGTSTRDIPAMLAAIGLAHDLGNPPFGHSGERAIQHWMTEHPKLLDSLADGAQREDFIRFEGNAQTLRLLTRLQLISDDFGLNLTCGTLAALMKYPTGSDQIDKTKCATKKHGFFQSEAQIVGDIWQETGLKAGQRHPFAYVMEACDDIAYGVLDAEDAVKKGLASFADLMAFLEQEIPADDISRCVIKDALADHSVHLRYHLSPSELNDISMQKFRVHAIALTIDRARQAFEDNLDGLLDGTLHSDLLELSGARLLCKALKRFDREHAYRHKSVLALESRGFNVIQELMDHLWYAIENREGRVPATAVRATPFAAYAYQRISENYRRVFGANGPLCERYRELQLLTDMISGMTDTYAMNLCDDLKEYHRS
jgi:dGTPase